MKTAEILMLGGINSGKSSVLAAIYDQAASIAEGLDLKIAIDDASAYPLIQNLMAIKSAFHKEDEIVEMDRFPNPREKAIEYIFNIGKPLSPPDQSLKFIDISGEDVLTNSAFVSKFLRCRTAILAVDTVELMKGGETTLPLDKKRNIPEMIYHYVQKWIEHAPNLPRLLVIVPIKTETWLRETETNTKEDIEANIEIIKSKIDLEYKKVFDLLKIYERNTAIVVSPVQTVGNLIFNSYKPNNGKYPIETWKKITGVKTKSQTPNYYSPVDCDQPLRYILNFYLIQAIAASRKLNKSDFEKFMEKFTKVIDSILGTELQKYYESIRETFLDIFGDDRHLAMAIAKFASDIKVDSPFEIVQGKEFLERDTILKYFT